MDTASEYAHLLSAVACESAIPDFRPLVEAVRQAHGADVALAYIGYCKFSVVLQDRRGFELFLARRTLAALDRIQAALKADPAGPLPDPDPATEAVAVALWDLQRGMDLAEWVAELVSQERGLRQFAETEDRPPSFNAESARSFRAGGVILGSDPRAVAREAERRRELAADSRQAAAGLRQLAERFPAALATEVDQAITAAGGPEKLAEDLAAHRILREPIPAVETALLKEIREAEDRLAGLPADIGGKSAESLRIHLEASSSKLKSLRTARLDAVRADAVRMVTESRSGRPAGWKVLTATIESNPADFSPGLLVTLRAAPRRAAEAAARPDAVIPSEPSEAGAKRSAPRRVSSLV